jgi:predicted small secreted protein
MRRIITIPTALVLATLALSGCAAGSSSDTQSGGVTAPMVDPGTEFSTDGSKSEVGAGDAVQVAPADRQVITTGWVTITVDDPMATASDAVRITEQSGGRVDGRSEYAPKDDTDKGSATLTLRIPSEKLTETLDKLRELGTVEEVSLNSNDVTMVTQDLDARISALSASIDRMLVLLSNATDTDALIQLETAISDRQAQLESLESERRYYADQVTLSTVTLNLVSEYNAPVTQPDTFLSGLVAGWNAFVAFFAGLLVALGVLLPWLLFAGIITFVVIWIVRWNRRRKAGTAAPVE